MIIQSRCSICDLDYTGKGILFIINHIADKHPEKLGFSTKITKKDLEKWVYGR